VHTYNGTGRETGKSGGSQREIRGEGGSGGFKGIGESVGVQVS